MFVLFTVEFFYSGADYFTTCLDSFKKMFPFMKYCFKIYYVVSALQ